MKRHPSSFAASSVKPEPQIQYREKVYETDFDPNSNRSNDDCVRSDGPGYNKMGKGGQN